MAPSCVESSPYKVLYKRPQHSPKIIFKRNDPTGEVPKKVKTVRPFSADEPVPKKIEHRRTDEYFIPPVSDTKVNPQSLLFKPTKLSVDTSIQALRGGTPTVESPPGSPYLTLSPTVKSRSSSRPQTAQGEGKGGNRSQSQTRSPSPSPDSESNFFGLISRSSSPVDYQFSNDVFGRSMSSPIGEQRVSSPRTGNDGNPRYAMWTQSKRVYSDENPFGMCNSDVFQFDEDKPYRKILLSHHSKYQEKKEQEQQAKQSHNTRQSAKLQSAKAAALLESMSFSQNDEHFHVLEEEYVKPFFTTAHYQAPQTTKPKKLSATTKRLAKKQETRNEYAAMYQQKLAAIIVKNHKDLAVVSESSATAALQSSPPSVSHAVSFPQALISPSSSSHSHNPSPSNIGNVSLPSHNQLSVSSSPTPAEPLFAASRRSSGNQLRALIVEEAGAISSGLMHRRGSNSIEHKQVYSSAGNLPYDVKMTWTGEEFLRHPPDKRERSWNTSTKFGGDK